MLDFQGMLSDFKRTDLDPRELILMYKYLLAFDKNDEAERPFIENLRNHFNKDEFTIDISIIIDRYRMQNDKMNINTSKKVQESKAYIINLLEHKNSMFVSDLNKNANKLIKF